MSKPDGLQYDIVQYASNANLVPVGQTTEAVMLYEKTSSDPKVDKIETMESISYKYYIRHSVDVFPWEAKTLFVILRKDTPVDVLSNIDFLLGKTNLLHADTISPPNGSGISQVFQGDVQMSNMWLSKGDRVYMVFQSFPRPQNPSAVKYVFNGVFKIKKTE